MRDHDTPRHRGTENSYRFSQCLGASVCWILWLALLVAPASVRAQLASPNKAGVSMGHLHYVVKDIEANKRFWAALGGTSLVGDGTLAMMKFPDVVIMLTQGESSG